MRRVLRASLAVTLVLAACSSPDERFAPGNDAKFIEQRAACAFGAGALPSETFGAAVAATRIPIDTFVIVMQENRSFDHYLSKLPEAGLADVDVARARATNPDGAGDPVARFHLTSMCVADTKHTWDPMHVAWDEGKNDGFVRANEPNGARVMGYYDASDIDFHYALATSYGVADHYFASVLGPTWPNRLYLYAGTSSGMVKNQDPPSVTSIFDLLDAAGLTFGVYRENGTSYEQVILPGLLADHPERFGSLDDYAAAASADQLPNLVFLYSGADEHPPQDAQKGDVAVQGVFTTLASSPAWMHSVFILTYDENGGFFDHVPPPPACDPDGIAPKLAPGELSGGFDRYGFRVPFLMASAWSKPRFVSHTVYDHTAVLRFVELAFGLPALSARDANASSLLEFFDFSEPRFATPAALPPASVDPAKLCQ